MSLIVFPYATVLLVLLGVRDRHCYLIYESAD